MHCKLLNTILSNLLLNNINNIFNEHIRYIILNNNIWIILCSNMLISEQQFVFTLHFTIISINNFLLFDFIVVTVHL